MLAACALPLACAPAPQSAGDFAQPEFGPAQLLDQCEGRDGWSDPAPPARLFANIYIVGTCGIVALLIATAEGHILIDGATEEAAASIAANIEALGFPLPDIRYIVTSHEHLDHVGGVAQLQQLSGAELIARQEARAVLEGGPPDPSDPQADHLPAFPAARVDRIIADGDTITLGPVTLTMHATPGHSPGSTSWSWRSCEGEQCRTIVYADSISSVSATGYRFSGHPDYVAAFRATFDKIAALDCDLLITPHPRASNLFERLAGEAPLADPQGCAAYAATGRQRLDSRLAEEAAAESE
ncbi:MAG: subclass B3 metallo-beta-lactamase [Sphingomonadaceae bacterium]|nr:subclass B3 metallo-beta-lactamase [Sphingomonadaceae bacterium]